MGILKHKPVIGTVYGQWVVISDIIKRNSISGNRSAYFQVRCKCGRECWRGAHTLKSGGTQACKSCCKSPNDRDRFILSYFNKIKGRARVSNFEFNLTPEYIEKLFKTQRGKCKLSNKPLYFKPTYKKSEQTASLDRIDNLKGYIKGNVQWVHKDINFMKGKLNLEEFLNYCELITKNKNP